MFILDFPDYEVIEPHDNEMFRRKDKDYMTATIDGSAINKVTKEKIVIEIKTHDWRKGDEEEWDNNIPFKYFVQCCHYLAVLNDFDGACLVAKIRYFDYSEHKRKVAKQEIRYYWIWRSDKSVQNAIKNLEKAETNFYENHIKTKIPPSFKISFQF
jgi:predicted phage-related endonuclease